MGNWLCRHRKIRVMFLGLEYVGKTSLLYHLQLGEVISTIPTIGRSSQLQHFDGIWTPDMFIYPKTWEEAKRGRREFLSFPEGYNTEIIDIDGIEVTLWDVTSRGKSRALWHHYFAGTDGFVFVIDSCEKDFFREAIEELSRVCYDDQTRDTVFMVVANKQDLDGAMSAQEIEDHLIERHFDRCMSQTIFVVPCNALDVKQVSQIFSRFTHFVCLNQAGKLKRGLITMKEQSEMEEASKESNLKSLLKSPVEFLKSLF